VVFYEQPDDARARRLAGIRALRGTPERLQRIADLALDKTRSKSRSTSSKSGRKTPENSAAMFGHPWPLWFQMRDAAFEYMCQCARDKRMTTYAELWDSVSATTGEDLGAKWRQLPILLGHVAEHSFAELHLIPSALVVAHEGDTEPGVGFFGIAAELGALPPSDAPEGGTAWTMTDTQRAYWQQTVTGMYDRFADTGAATDSETDVDLRI
jgi:hypothetical protein